MLQKAEEERLDFDDELLYEDEYDPLEYVPDENDEDYEELDNPEFNTPENSELQKVQHQKRISVYTPQRCGSAQAACRKLIEGNPGRKYVLLGMLDACRDGMLASELSVRVDELQKDNWSVYSPMALCRMLQGAGAIELEMPDAVEEHVNYEEGYASLTIDEEVDPTWRTTQAGLEVYEQFQQGNEWRKLVIEEEPQYAEVYLAVMQRLLVGPPASKKDIEEVTDAFEVTKKPRKFGMHFVSRLESGAAASWGSEGWVLTTQGEQLLLELEEFCERRAQGMREGQVA